MRRRENIFICGQEHQIVVKVKVVSVTFCPSHSRDSRFSDTVDETIETPR